MIDIRTLGITGAIIYVFLLLALYLTNRLTGFKDYKHWISSFSVLTIGLFFIALRGILPAFISVVIANVLYVLHYLLLVTGFQSTLQIKIMKKNVLVAILVSFGILYWIFTVPYPNVAVRIYIITILIMVISVYLIRIITRYSKVINIKNNEVVLLALLLMVISGILRVIFTYKYDADTQLFFEGSMVQVVAFLAQIISTILLCLGLISLNTQLYYRDNNRNLLALETTANELRAAQNVAKTGSWKLDLTTYKLRWSEEIYRMFDCEPYEFEATIESFLNFTHPEDREKVNLAYTESLKTNKPYEIEHRLITKKNEVKYVLEKGRTTFDEDGNPLVSSGVVIDITSAKKTEHKLKEAKEIAEKSERNLQEINKLKDKFLAIIAHDLKSPFNAIQGFSELLVNRINESKEEEVCDKVRNYAEIIYSSSKKATGLLENLMEWALIEAGDIRFKPEMLTITEIIDQNKEELESSLKLKSIQLIDNSPENMEIYADKSMLNSILRNILSNAIKFTPKLGQITITSQQDKNETKISIQDTGIGMNEDTRTKIFENYELESQPGTDNEMGTGLGLILCKQFVKKHEGEIWVESKINKGTTFHFSLPNKKDESIK